MLKHEVYQKAAEVFGTVVGVAGMVKVMDDITTEDFVGPEEYKKVSEYIDINDIICIPNEGMNIYNDNLSDEDTKRGDLYIIFNIIYPNKNIPKNIQINTNNNIIKISSNNDVSINNMELFTLLLEQKNNNNKNNKQTIITKSTKNISLKTKNYIKMLLIQKNDNIDIDIDI